MCISGFNLFMGENVLSYLFDKKRFWKKEKEKRETRGEKRKTKQEEREREKEKTGLFQFSNQTYPSRPICRFSTLHLLMSLVTYKALNFKSRQFCSLSFNAHVHMFLTKCKTSVALKPEYFTLNSLADFEASDF